MSAESLLNLVLVSRPRSVSLTCVYLAPPSPHDFTPCTESALSVCGGASDFVLVITCL